jgi:hypothetical protein
MPNSIRHASKAFGVPRTTLRRRRAGKPLRRDTKSRLKKLDKLEEAIVTRILKLDARGIGATRAIVQEIANNLLAARSGGPVSKN